MKSRAKSRFRRTAEVVVLLSVTAVSAVLFQRHRTADEVDEAALRKTEAMVQDVAERSEDLVKNGPRYFVDGLKTLYNPSGDIRYAKLDIYDDALRCSPDNPELLGRRLDILIELRLGSVATSMQTCWLGKVFLKRHLSERKRLSPSRRVWEVAVR